MKSIALLMALFLTPGAALADEWFHAAAPMGQFEGGYNGQPAEVYYGCSGLGSSLTVHVRGNRAGNGKGSISVDGVAYADLPLTFSGQSGDTTLEYEVRGRDSAEKKAAFNAFLKALAAGNTMTVSLGGTGTVAVPLTNSAQIAVCAVR